MVALLTVAPDACHAPKGGAPVRRPMLGHQDGGHSRAATSANLDARRKETRVEPEEAAALLQTGRVDAMALAVEGKSRTPLRGWRQARLLGHE